MIVNMGEQLEFLSGGHFQATRHRGECATETRTRFRRHFDGVSTCLSVVDPPPDQQGIPRPTVVIFNACRNAVSLAPLIDAPLLKRKGFIPRFEQLTDNPTAGLAPL